MFQQFTEASDRVVMGFATDHIYSPKTSHLYHSREKDESNKKQSFMKISKASIFQSFKKPINGAKRDMRVYKNSFTQQTQFDGSPSRSGQSTKMRSRLTQVPYQTETRSPGGTELKDTEYSQRMTSRLNN